jgi:membrane-associated phospholipid phosphatase
MVVYFSYRDMSNLNRAIYAFTVLLLSCVLVFWLWPTVIARDLFPAPPTLDPYTGVVLAALRQADTPANCFPSFHVASVYLACFLLSSEGRWKFLFFLIWATAIAVSTLTTKQHYFADVVSGFTLAVILYYAFRNARIEFAPATPQAASAMRRGNSD